MNWCCKRKEWESESTRVFSHFFSRQGVNVNALNRKKGRKRCIWFDWWRNITDKSSFDVSLHIKQTSWLAGNVQLIVRESITTHNTEIYILLLLLSSSYKTLYISYYWIVTTFIMMINTNKNDTKWWLLKTIHHDGQKSTNKATLVL